MPAKLFKEVTSQVDELATVKQSKSSGNEFVFTLKPKANVENQDTMDPNEKLKPLKLHKTADPKSSES